MIYTGKKLHGFMHLVIYIFFLQKKDTKIEDSKSSLTLQVNLSYWCLYVVCQDAFLHLYGIKHPNKKILLGDGVHLK